MAVLDILHDLLTEPGVEIDKAENCREAFMEWSEHEIKHAYRNGYPSRIDIRMFANPHEVFGRCSLTKP